MHERKTIHSKQVFKSRRKDLRNNSTQEERLLWEKLRKKRLGYKFERQHSIGPYITDFYCPSKKLVIELDGNQHLENCEYDQERSNYLEGLGIKILRFWNHEINLNINTVVNRVVKSLK